MEKNSIEMIKNNNECVEVLNQKDGVIIKKCWNDDSCVFKFNSKDSLNFLNNMVFPKELFGIYHKDKKVYEFIYAPLLEKNNRSFEYIYQGKPYKLYYDVPSTNFKELVCGFSFNNDPETITDRYIGLARFHLYYQKEKKSMFPTNFFIKGDFDDNYNEHLLFFKHVNLMMTFYDRKSPYIQFFDTTENEINDDIKIPCKHETQVFPKIINSKKLNSTLLELLEAARVSNSNRMKYIFYYQILEYCSYYYLENEFKRNLTNIIKEPDILNSDKYSARIIELYSDYFKNNHDVQKMEKMIKDLCIYDDIKEELKTNAKYFIGKTCFDGGLVIEGIFNNENEIDNPPQRIKSNIMPIIRKNIDVIRNVLVHARESRENVNISPTHKNAILLRPYLFLLRRIAEIVVIKFEE